MLKGQKSMDIQQSQLLELVGILFTRSWTFLCGNNNCQWEWFTLELGVFIFSQKNMCKVILHMVM